MTELRKRLAREEGVAMVVVMGVMLVVALFSAAFAIEASQSSRDSNNDRNSVRALGAAQEGLAMANYRLNTLHPPDNQCVTNVLSAPNLGSDCVLPNQPAGTGASYTYYVTTSPPGTGCDALPSNPSGGSQRCITSIGIVNGQVRRVQERVFVLPPYIPVHGVLGLNLVQVQNNMNFNGSDLGSNTLIDLGNNDNFGYAQLGPGATCNCGGANYSGNVNNPTQFTVQPVPIDGTETACTGAAAPGCNNNVVLGPTDGYTSNRSLIMTHDLTLPSGDYNFCRLDFNGFNLSPAPGAVIRIFIDAPASVRSGSGCPDNTTPPTASPMWGELHGDNAASINAPNGNAANAQIFVYGWPPASSYATNWGVNTITFSKNNGELDAMIFAPNSVVNLAKNNGSFNGGVSGYQVFVKNNITFQWDPGLLNLGQTANVKGWFECTPTPPNPSVPESGC